MICSIKRCDVDLTTAKGVCFFVGFGLLFKLFALLIPCRFTPDFTSSRVIRELKLVTCGGSEFVFVLNASLPYHMLAACAETLPRPSWELELYVIVSLIMRWSAPALCFPSRVPFRRFNPTNVPRSSPQRHVSAGHRRGLAGGSEHLGAFQEARVGGIQLARGGNETLQSQGNSADS